jgi:tRNA A37 threonylcarbamoyladenosine dehydratase
MLKDWRGAYNSGMKNHQHRFSGIERLYGKGSLQRLGQCHVAVIGVGGVGSWLVEALARSGVGQLSLFDADDICLSNTNRQLHALDGHYGENKVDAMRSRCLAINPDITVNAVPSFITTGNMADVFGSGFDLVIDACDSFRVKVELIVWCRRRKQKIIVVGAAGGRTDPTQIRIRDLAKTEQDALLALIRRKLRTEFKFPKSKNRYFSVPAVYSLENVQYPQADGSVCGIRPETDREGGLKLDCGDGLGAATHVTGAFAFAAAAKSIELLLKVKTE